MLSRKLLQYSYCRLCGSNGTNPVARFTTQLGLKNTRKRPSALLIAGVPLTATVAGYYLYKSQQIVAPETVPRFNSQHVLLADKPDVPVSRSMTGVLTDYNLNLTLYQYPTCPFCCKVRAFLDYYGFPYDVVEVDPVLRQQTSWTTYKKVPILLAKVDGGYQQLNDSSMIISALKTFLINDKQSLDKIVEYYPVIDIRDENGNIKSEIQNRYSLMFGDTLSRNKTDKMITEEKTWREWADNTLVHTLSPNIYRTFDEAMQAFTWFSDVGEWDKLFPAWERNIIVYVGAVAMYFIGKRLKKRHNLKEDVRESLYDACNYWTKALSAKKTMYMGGNTPNLADLAVYGVLSSIEGCLAFKDLLDATSIGNWYFHVKEAVKNHKGSESLRNEVSRSMKI